MSDEELVKALRLLAFVHNDGAITQAADHIEALTEQLEAARADAKEAEAYAEELEKQLNICRMAQVVMENGIAQVERERDDYAFKLADANNTYSEMHVALSEANDKLAKAVEGLNYCINAPLSGWTIAQGYARTKLAEIEGEKG